VHRLYFASRKSGSTCLGTNLATTESSSYLCNTFKPFPKTGTQWLDSNQILKCVHCIQYIRYPEAKHLSRIGLTNKIGTVGDIPTCFPKAASNAPLDDNIEIYQALRESLQETGPSPAIVVADDRHFNVILIKPQLKSVMLFDPFGTGFLQSVEDYV